MSHRREGDDPGRDSGSPQEREGATEGPGHADASRSEEANQAPRREEVTVSTDPVPRGEEARPLRERPPARARWSVVATSVVDYLFYILYALLGLRFLLAAVGAREDAGFVQLVRNITTPFYAPFEGIVAAPGTDGAYLDFPILIALVGYLVLHLAIRGLLRIIGQQTD